MTLGLIGLTREADKYIKENMKSSNSYEIDFSGEDFDLYTYLLKDGRKLTETVQNIKKNNVYLCLKDEEGNSLFEWDL